MRSRLKILKYLDKRSRKNITWKYRRRWIYIQDILDSIDEILENKKVDKTTNECLLRLFVSVEQTRNRMKSNVMPLKAWKILLKPIKLALKKL